MKTFLSTIYGKAIAVLTIIALLLGIVAEGRTIYRQSIGAMIDRENLVKISAEAQSAVVEARAKTREAPRLWPEGAPRAPD
jgi:hypothetical protein